MPNPILLVNAGSSSAKYQVIDVDTEEVLANGLIERIGQNMGVLRHTVDGQTHQITERFADHTAGLAAMVRMFEEFGPSLDQVKAVGHRAVHGGDRLTEATLIDDDVIATLAELSPLAPLHNPAGIAAIRGAKKALPDVPHVAVFDTAFFSTLPVEAYTYAIPFELQMEYDIRRYGFHGTSHDYVSHKAAEFLGRNYFELNQMVCHLGNGASISAIQKGRAVDTTMGLTPLQGLVMGTRAGDIDPGLIPYLNRVAGLDIGAIDELLNKMSGMLGLTGMSDMRDVEKAMNKGDSRSRLAWEIYTRRIAGYIGRYYVLMEGAEAITFTAGIGENSATIRRDVVNRLKVLGVKLDEEANAIRSPEPRRISTDDSSIAILVIPTNEELQMAREVKAVVSR